MDPDVTVVHAGTSLTGTNHIVTSGGRVLALVAVQNTLQSAIEVALRASNAVQFEGKFYRKDIGAAGLQERLVRAFIDKAHWLGNSMVMVIMMFVPRYQKVTTSS